MVPWNCAVSATTSRTPAFTFGWTRDRRTGCASTRRTENMAFMSCMGACYGCGRVFMFNPVWVPSVAGEPICEACMTLVNQRRKAAGEPAIHIHPDAYGAEEVPG